MRKGVAAGLFALLFLTLIVTYLPALQSGYIWNDNTYLTENKTLDGLEGLKLIWTEPKANEQYYPMVFSMFWLEKRLWGLHPFGYHFVNLLLHAASAVLLGLFLRRLKLPGAFFAAALFAFHPLCVESVAWVTERKNTLSLFLSLLSMHAYWQFLGARVAPAQPKKKRKPAVSIPWYRQARVLYAAAILALTLALFAKTTASVVPAVILVVLWWQNGRLGFSDVRPVLPFFLIGIGLAGHTAWFEKTMVQASGDEWSLSMPGRVVLAGRVVAFYAGKLLFPKDLVFIYPRWTVDPTVFWQWIPSIAALTTLGAAWFFRGRIGRGPLASLLLFGGVLFPAMGFFNVYSMRYSYVADHFAYQAAAVFAASAVCGLAGFLERLGPVPNRAAAATGLAGIAVLGVLSHQQSKDYRDEETLWVRTLEKNPACFMCHTNYGFLLTGRGQIDQAVRHFEESLRIKPDAVPTLLNLSRMEEQRGRVQQAAAHLENALNFDPANPVVLNNLATMYTKLGRYQEAVVRYSEALRYPAADEHLTHNGLGVALMGLGRPREAAEQFREALRLKPDYWRAQANLEQALAAGQVQPRPGRN